MCRFLYYSLIILALTQSTINADCSASIPKEAPKIEGSAIHGLLDIAFKNDYITPRGLLVTDTGLTIQVLSILTLEVYKDKDPCTFINNLSLVGGGWNDIWTVQHDPYVGPWNEFDWFAGFVITFDQNWKLATQFLEFLSPPHHFKTERNLESTLSYDDSKWNLPIVFNPYAKFFWAISGDSTVVVGKHGHTYYVELGITPTLDLNRYGIPTVITSPTWITIGPAQFWNGSILGIKKEKSHFGVFSTGLTAKTPLTWIPTAFGNWYFSINVQYYHLINDNLLKAQTFTLILDSIKDAHRDIGVVNGGIGFEF